MTVNQPDRAEKIIRFICGGVVGLLIGLSLLWVLDPSLLIGITVVIISILISGISAMILGDRFWESLKYWWLW